jgi:FO synthase subunit 1
MSRTVTYSPAYTLVPTYECFNRCTYCNFRTQPLQSPWLTLAEAETQLKLLQTQGVIEILILSGEVHPQSQRRKAWFQRIYDLCELALSLGFLPHTNVGPLSFEEMAQLKQVNVSMGLMLEQLSPDLLQTVHRHAPSKVPALRLQQLVCCWELGKARLIGLRLWRRSPGFISVTITFKKLSSSPTAPEISKVGTVKFLMLQKCRK